MKEIDTFDVFKAPKNLFCTFFRDVDALNDYLHGSNSKSVSDSCRLYILPFLECLPAAIRYLTLMHEITESTHSPLSWFDCLFFFCRLRRMM